MPTVGVDIGVLQSTTRMHGIGRYVYDLARGLAALQEHSPGSDGLRLVGVELGSWTGEVQLHEDLAASAERLRSAPEAMLSHVGWAYRQRLGMAGASRRSQLDALHTGHPEATPLGPLGCPRINTCHDLIPFRHPELYTSWRDGFGRGRRWLDARRYARAEHLIAVSQATADDMVRLLQIPSSKISVVHNGVDIGRWSAEPQVEDRARLAVHNLHERPFLLYVGAADWRKNAVGMLAGLARARRATGRDVQVAWAGGLRREQISAISQAAEALGISRALQFLGYVDDATLGALYRHARANLFVSRAEGFGYPVIEAMASGCPVIASDCSSTAEVAGDAALSVSPEDHVAIGAAIVALWDDDAARGQLRTLGLQQAQRFSLERMARDTREVYRQVVA